MDDIKIEEKPPFIGEKLAPFNPINHDAIDIAIRMLIIRPHDIIYDLGCGDARFLIKVRHPYLRIEWCCL